MELKLDKKTVRRLLICAVAVILIYWILNASAQVRIATDWIMKILTPFIVGAVLAFIINVPMRAFERVFHKIKNLKLRRCAALVSTLVCIAVVIALVLWLLIPQLVQTIKNLVQILPVHLRNAYDSIIKAVESRPNLHSWIVNNVKIQDIDWSTLVNKVLAWVEKGIPQAFSVIGSLFATLFNGFISIAFAIYALFQKEALARQGRKILYSLLPETRADYIVKVLRLSNKTFSNFLSGQCVEAVILGSLFAVTMLIFNLGREYIALVSVLVAVTAFIPVVGAWIGCIVGAFLISVSSSLMSGLWFVVLSIIVQQIENNFIYPRVVGNSIGLSGMWVLVAVSVGASISGVVGMFLMIPVTSVVYVLIREAVHKRIAGLQVDSNKLEPQPPELEPHFLFGKKNKKPSPENNQDNSSK